MECHLQDEKHIQTAYKSSKWHFFIKKE